MKLAFENLCKSYSGHTVFENIIGEINEGDVIGLLGQMESGSRRWQKFAGIEAVDSGTVQYFQPYQKLYI